MAIGAQELLGKFALFIVVFGTLFATSSAISGTLFGASRLIIAVTAKVGYLPKKLSNRIKAHIANNAIITMGVFAFILILSGGLKIILEFGSITFIIVSFLRAYANHKKRKETSTHSLPAIIAIIGLFGSGILIFYFEFTENPVQFIYIFIMYLMLIIGAFVYSKKGIISLQ